MRRFYAAAGGEGNEGVAVLDPWGMVLDLWIVVHDLWIVVLDPWGTAPDLRIVVLDSRVTVRDSRIAVRDLWAAVFDPRVTVPDSWIVVLNPGVTIRDPRVTVLNRCIDAPGAWHTFQAVSVDGCQHIIRIRLKKMLKKTRQDGYSFHTLCLARRAWCGRPTGKEASWSLETQEIVYLTLEVRRIPTTPTTNFERKRQCRPTRLQM